MSYSVVTKEWKVISVHWLQTSQFTDFISVKTEFSNWLILKYEYSFMWWWTDTPTDILPEGSARCVQSFDDSLDFAIRMTYRISLRSSSLWEPRHPLLKVLFPFIIAFCIRTWWKVRLCRSLVLVFIFLVYFNHHFLFTKSGSFVFWYTRAIRWLPFVWKGRWATTITVLKSNRK